MLITLCRVLTYLYFFSLSLSLSLCLSLSLSLSFIIANQAQQAHQAHVGRRRLFTSRSIGCGSRWPPRASTGDPLSPANPSLPVQWKLAARVSTCKHHNVDVLPPVRLADAYLCTGSGCIPQSVCPAFRPLTGKDLGHFDAQYGASQKGLATPTVYLEPSISSKFGGDSVKRVRAQARGSAETPRDSGGTLDLV